MRSLKQCSSNKQRIVIIVIIVILINEILMDLIVCDFDPTLDCNCTNKYDNHYKIKKNLILFFHGVEVTIRATGLCHPLGKYISAA